jgi:hypothetical protein
VQIFFHAISRGKQCVANCAGFFFVQLKMKKESLTAWTSVDLDNILCCGDYLYKEIYKACRLQGDYLHPSNIPCHLQWENVVFGYKIMSLCEDSQEHIFQLDNPNHSHHVHENQMYKTHCHQNTNLLHFQQQ